MKNDEPKTFQGKRCRRGHSGERYIANRNCVECAAEYAGIRARRSLRKPPIPGTTAALKALWRRRRGLPEPTRLCPLVCEACLEEPGEKGMHLDHCHETGKFRGWLCGKCNAGIGMLGDDVSGLLNAISYLTRKHQ